MIGLRRVSDHNIFVNQWIQSLVIWMFLFKGSLFNMYYSFIPLKLMGNKDITHTLMKLI